MPTLELISRQPPFPDDVPICDLAKVSYARLLANDHAESDRLFQTCKDTGFFLLDLQGTTQGRSLLKDAEGMLEVTCEFGRLAKLEKSRYASKPPEVSG